MNVLSHFFVDLVDCTEGTFYNNLTQSCTACPIGQYQNKTGQSECTPCGRNLTTESIGSQSSSDCFGMYAPLSICNHFN